MVKFSIFVRYKNKVSSENNWSSFSSFCGTKNRILKNMKKKKMKRMKKMNKWNQNRIETLKTYGFRRELMRFLQKPMLKDWLGKSCWGERCLKLKRPHLQVPEYRYACFRKYGRTYPLPSYIYRKGDCLHCSWSVAALSSNLQLSFFLLLLFLESNTDVEADTPDNVRAIQFCWKNGLLKYG